MTNLSDLILREIGPKKSKYLSLIKHNAGEDLAYATIKGLEKIYNHHLPLTSGKRVIGRNALAIDPIASAELVSEEGRAIAEAHIGFELLKVLKKQGLLDWKLQAKDSQGNDIHMEKRVYKFVYRDHEKIMKAILLVNLEAPKVRLSDYPIIGEVEDRRSFWTGSGGSLLRRANPKVVKLMTKEGYNSSPMLYDAFNKLRKLKFSVNTEMLDVVLSQQSHKLFTREGKLLTEEQRISIMDAEQRTIDAAVKYKDQEFSSEVFGDWRTRLYFSLTEGLSPQGSDLSKSLLRFSQATRIGAKGYKALLAVAATHYGNDKIHYKDRIKFSESRMEEWMLWANDPNQWFNSIAEVDNPLLFLATIIEIRNARQCQNKHNYKSALPLQLDATTSGLQILSALSRDKKSGRLCNLVPSSTRADSYMAVANHIWGNIKPIEADLRLFRELLSEVKRLQALYLQEQSEDALEALESFIKLNKESLKSTAHCFWYEYEHLKRKLVKRGTMTRFYAAGKSNMADQIMEDWAAELPGLTIHHARWLGNMIYDACSEVFPGPVTIMDQLSKLAKKVYDTDGEDFGYINPITGAPMMQNYRKNRLKRVKFLDTDGRPMFLSIVVGKNELFDVRGLICGGAVNTVHNLDATLCTMVINACPFDMYTIHDAFLCRPSDYFSLKDIIREQFVKMFEVDILKYIFEENAGIELWEKIKYGQLNVNQVVRNDYCFD